MYFPMLRAIQMSCYNDYHYIEYYSTHIIIPMSRLHVIRPPETTANKTQNGENHTHSKYSLSGLCGDLLPKLGNPTG